jgi:HEAT repeat protein
MAEPKNDKAIAITVLCDKLLSDPDKTVRSQIAEALGKIGQETAISALLQVLDDPSPLVRQQVVQAIKSPFD